MKRPLAYYGGKWRTAPTILKYFPPHETYVEVFGGAASVLLQKSPSLFEVYNDLDEHVCNFFRVLREHLDELQRRFDLTPYSRKEFENCRIPHSDPVEDARRFFVSCWMSISKIPFEKAFGWCQRSYAEQGFTFPNIDFRNAIQALPDVTTRLLQVTFECRPFEYILSRYDTPNTLFYCDPPYMIDTRSSKKKYLIEMTEECHKELAEILQNAKGMIVLSGYHHPLYHTWYDREGWQRIEFESQANKGTKTECLWLSPRTVDALQRPKQLTLL